jgi:hypothetical protein
LAFPAKSWKKKSCTIAGAQNIGNKGSYKRRVFNILAQNIENEVDSLQDCEQDIGNKGFKYNNIGNKEVIARNGRSKPGLKSRARRSGDRWANAQRFHSGLSRQMAIPHTLTIAKQACIRCYFSR